MISCNELSITQWQHHQRIILLLDCGRELLFQLLNEFFISFYRYIISLYVLTYRCLYAIKVNYWSVRVLFFKYSLRLVNKFCYTVRFHNNFCIYGNHNVGAEQLPFSIYLKLFVKSYFFLINTLKVLMYNIYINRKSYYCRR